jgi:hypothetical protein
MRRWCKQDKSHPVDRLKDRAELSQFGMTTSFEIVCLVSISSVPAPGLNAIGRSRHTGTRSLSFVNTQSHVGRDTI